MAGIPIGLRVKMWNRDTQCEMLTWNQTSINDRNVSKQHCRTCAAAGRCNSKKCRLANLRSLTPGPKLQQNCCFKSEWQLAPTRLNRRWTRHWLWWAGPLLVSCPGKKKSFIDVFYHQIRNGIQGCTARAPPLSGISGSTWNLNECLPGLCQSLGKSIVA
jgi:hypothetical protein